MSIVCALCGRTAVRYYPARRAVREKLSGRHYCSDEHSKRHWAILNQQERQASKEAYPCLGPDCREWIEPRPGPGRPSDYCSVSCREAARRARDRPVAGAVARGRIALGEAEALVQDAYSAVKQDPAIAQAEAVVQQLQYLAQQRQQAVQQAEEALLRCEQRAQEAKQEAETAQEALRRAQEEAKAPYPPRVMPFAEDQRRQDKLEDLSGQLRRAQKAFYGAPRLIAKAKADLQQANESLWEAQEAVEITQQELQQQQQRSEELLRSPLEALREAKSKLHKAEERAARRAQQAREGRARKAAERDRKQAESDFEFRDWLMRQQGWA